MISRCECDGRDVGHADRSARAGDRKWVAAGRLPSFIQSQEIKMEQTSVQTFATVGAVAANAMILTTLAEGRTYPSQLVGLSE